MSEANFNPCSAWASIEDMELMPDFDPDDLLEPQIKLDALQAATNILYRLSGKQFPGLCTATIRPCRRASWNPLGTFGWSSNYSASYGWSSSWGVCGCDSYSACNCSGISQIELGAANIVSIQSVKVDGTTLSASTYRIDNGRLLVRTDGKTWPTSQDLSQPSSATNTFEVSFTYGHSIPSEIKHMCARYAYELCKSYRNADNCLLPERITQVTRQGTSMVLIDPQAFIEAGKVGIREIDQWLYSVNPYARMQSASILGPDEISDYRRVNT